MGQVIETLGIQHQRTADIHAPAAEWLAVWNRLKPAILDITGGEPFLLPDLVDLLAGLDPDIRVGLTSNLSHPLIEFVRRVSAERMGSITVTTVRLAASTLRLIW